MHEVAQQPLGWHRPRDRYDWGEETNQHSWGVIGVYLICLLLFSVLSQKYYGEGTAFLGIFLGGVVLLTAIFIFLFAYKGGVSCWFKPACPLPNSRGQ